MKKLINRFLGVVVAAALLVGTAMPNVAVMAESHTHKEGAAIKSPTTGFTIELTNPKGLERTDACYGAYQIFSGTVKGDSYTEGKKENPGSEGTKIPITDIKWGNAFGITDGTDTENNVSELVRNKRIVGFVIALAKASKGEYSYAFSGFKGFDETDATKAFIKTVGGKDYLADRFVSDSGNIDADSADFSKVNFDKLAVAVSDVIAGHTDHEWLQAFVDILGGYAAKQSDDPDGNVYHNEGYVNRFYESTWDDVNKEYKIVVPAGYYMIKDLSSIETTDTGEAYSARMLFVANNIKQVLKEDIPELEKQIIRNDSTGKEGTFDTDVAGVGDVVHFQLKGSLPSNYDNYLGGYQYTFIDVLSTGLDLSTKNGTDYSSSADMNNYVTVTAKGLFRKTGSEEWTWDSTAEQIIPIEYTEYTIDDEASHTHHLTTGTAGTDQSKNNYDASYDADDRELTVKFICLKEIIIQDQKDDNTYYRLGYNTETGKEQSSEIYVDYFAKLNKNALVKKGNENKAILKYSDNPQAYADTQTTIEHKAKVYTFGLDIIKVDAADFLKNNGQEGSTLNDVKFALVRKKSGTSGSNTKWEIAMFDTITADTIGSSSGLPSSFETNGYYTINSWATLQKDGSDVEGATFNDEWLADYGAYSIATLSGGILNISGLDAGVTYTMVETEAPLGGYKKIDPFDITLTAEMSSEEYTGVLKEATSGDKEVTKGESFSLEHYVDIIDPEGKSGETLKTDDDGSANMLVANFKYVDLPSTGGIGIYPFYIIGGIVVAGSIILFALSRRKKTA